MAGCLTFEILRAVILEANIQVTVWWRGEVRSQDVLSLFFSEPGGFRRAGVAEI